ncbi:growth arrest-specific protein 1 [Electrophorus electricus]|uniref:growth arrest-specific protein 1 n=1 Tax=Electrophorus electricus TaxID=8005 RepID=UPI0015D0B626|nr:growth arrest-specific protein 1 [Electrophorus electricus]
MGPWCGPVPFLLSLLVALSAQSVCWQAILRCHEEQECERAYGQYVAACDSILRGARRHCPSHCVSALVRLNRTVGGAELESCDCGPDTECRRAKRVIEPCLPRMLPPGDGCTEARGRCEADPVCRAALGSYLAHCGQLFNGRKCPSRCRATIGQLLLLPAGAALDRCACDGAERPFCEVVKENMARLCDAAADGHDGPDDLYEDEDYEAKGDGEGDPDATVPSSAAPHLPSHGTLFWGALALALLRD